MRPIDPPRFRIWSDLHLEFGDVHAARLRPRTPRSGEVVLLTGDIATGTAGIRWAIKAFPDHLVAYVLGNHEFYHADLEVTIEACREAAAGTNVWLLERDVWDLTRILGATLWTDYALWGQERADSARMAAHALTDHRLIVTDGRAFSPEDALRRHVDTRLWLEAELARAAADGVRAVVLTHHAPHASCVHEVFRRRHDPLSAAFASDFSDLLRGPSAPAVWVSGHTHHNFIGSVGRTRLVSNQGGYAFRGEDEDFMSEGLAVALV